MNYQKMLALFTALSTISATIDRYKKNQISLLIRAPGEEYPLAMSGFSSRTFWLVTHLIICEGIREAENALVYEIALF